MKPLTFLPFYINKMPTVHFKFSCTGFATARAGEFVAPVALDYVGRFEFIFNIIHFRSISIVSFASS